MKKASRKIKALSTAVSTVAAALAVLSVIAPLLDPAVNHNQTLVR